MVDSTIALQVKSPEISDLSTTLLRAYQIKNAQQQNELQPLRMQQMQQQTALGGLQLQNAQERQGALSDYSMRANAGDPNARQALVGQPDLMAKVFENMTADREQKIRRIGDAAKAVYPLRGQPGFKEAWQREMDNLHKGGDIPDETYKQWRDNPSDLALNQALSMSLGLDAYLKAEGQSTAAKIVTAIQPLLTPGASEGGGVPTRPAANVPQVDPYAANVISKESGGRNIANAAGASSAGGVMQFTKGTWNDVITKNPDLGLMPEDRMDPQKQIVAERRFRQENAISLIDAKVVPTDRNLYMAHFLGGAGASKFLTGMAENPEQPATNLVSSEAAAANRSIFFSPGGQPLTARQVYENQTSRFGNGMAGISGIAPQPTAAIAPMATVNDRIAAAVPQLIGLAMTPGIPEDTRKTLLELGKAGITAGQPTTEEKNYQSYARGEIEAHRVPLPRLSWEQAKKRPPVFGTSDFGLNGQPPAPGGQSANTPATQAEPINPDEVGVQLAYGPKSMLSAASARASDIARGTMPEGLQKTYAAISQAEVLRNEAINALTLGSTVPGRLKMVQERVQDMVPKPGEFTHGPAEAATKWNALKTELTNEYNQQLTIIDAKNVGYNQEAKQKAAEKALALRKSIGGITEFLGGSGVGAGSSIEQTKAALAAGTMKSSDIIEQAKVAIANGKSRDAVLQRLKELNIATEGL